MRAPWATEAYAKSMQELWDLKRTAEIRSLMHRFIVETDRQYEFLDWVAKDMGLDKPMGLTRVDALIATVLNS